MMGTSNLSKAGTGLSRHIPPTSRVDRWKRGSFLYRLFYGSVGSIQNPARNLIDLQIEKRCNVEND